MCKRPDIEPLIYHTTNKGETHLQISMELLLLLLLLNISKAFPKETGFGEKSSSQVLNISLLAVMFSYKCSEASSTSSDLELSIQVSDGSSGEETLNQQQNAKYKESSCKAIDDVLQDVDTV